MNIIIELTINDQMYQQIEEDTREDVAISEQSVSSSHRQVFDIQPQASAYMLNPKYTFDSYVVGQSNRFSHAASLAVSKAPGKAYNPFFILTSQPFFVILLTKFLAD